MSIVNIFAKGHNIYLFNRGEDKKLYVEKNENFYPYFYIEDQDGEYISLFGEKLKRVIVNHPGEIERRRNAYSKTWESDVTYVNRYLIDKFNKIEKTRLKYHIIDIEVLSINGRMADPRQAKAPIIAITVYDNFYNKYFSFIWRKGFEEYYEKKENWFILYFSEEQNMLDSFVFWEKNNIPDIWLGWGTQYYDFPYLFKRVGKEKISEISPIGEAGFDGFGYYVAGISLLDCLSMYKLVMSRQKKERYSLDYISRIELNDSKINLSNSIDKLYKENIDILLEYNRKDVELVKRLEEKLHLIAYFDNIRRIARCTFRDVYQNSRVCDNLFLCFAKDKNLVLPSKKENIKEEYIGGFVKEPVKGFYENVVVLDATALYPSIIISFNLSPETLNPEGDIIIGDYVRVTSKEEGLFSFVCKYMLDLRKNIKNQMKQYKIGSKDYYLYYIQQYTLKGLINSIYGYTAFKNSRFYSKALASTITYIGRELIKFIETGLKKDDISVLYADTDSLFIPMNDGDLKQAKKIQNIVNRNVGKFIRGFGLSKHCIEFKLEKIYKSLVIGAKKRYAGIILWENDQYIDRVEIVGYDVRRSDVPEIVRDFQKELFGMILSKKREKEIKEFVNNFLFSLKDKKHELGFPVAINKNLSEYKSLPIHIRASLYSNKYHNMDIGFGDSIKYYFVKRVPDGQPFTNVVAIKEGFESLLGNYVLDFDEAKRRVLMKIDPIFDVIGWSRPEVDFSSTKVRHLRKIG